MARCWVCCSSPEDAVWLLVFSIALIQVIPASCLAIKCITVLPCALLCRPPLEVVSAFSWRTRKHVRNFSRLDCTRTSCQRARQRCTHCAIFRGDLTLVSVKGVKPQPPCATRRSLVAGRQLYWKISMASLFCCRRLQHNMIYYRLSIEMDLPFLSNKPDSGRSVMWCDVLDSGVGGGGPDQSEQPRRESRCHHHMFMAAVGFVYLIELCEAAETRVRFEWLAHRSEVLPTPPSSKHPRTPLRVPKI